MGEYRYLLTRTIDPLLRGDRSVLFVMLNPSTADERHDDPTIRRCRSFAERDRAAVFQVVNLYAFRATDPSDLVFANEARRDVVGPENDATIFRTLRAHAAPFGRIVLAWGAHPFARHRLARLAELHRDAGAPPLWCLGRCADGSPRHPLFVKSDQPFDPFTLETEVRRG